MQFGESLFGKSSDVSLLYLGTALRRKCAIRIFHQRSSKRIGVETRCQSGAAAV
jgi:hypothetical protein